MKFNYWARPFEDDVYGMLKTIPPGEYQDLFAVLLDMTEGSWLRLLLINARRVKDFGGDRLPSLREVRGLIRDFKACGLLEQEDIPYTKPRTEDGYRHCTPWIFTPRPYWEWMEVKNVWEK